MGKYFSTLQKGAGKICLVYDSLNDLRLSAAFFKELFEKTGLSTTSLSYDLLGNIVSRESLSRLKTQAEPDYQLNAASSLAVVFKLLCTRDVFVLINHGKTSGRFPDKVVYAQKIRQQVLDSLYEHGVSCAKGECCNLVDTESFENERSVS